MGIRQTLNEKPAIAIGLAAAILLIAGFLIVKQFNSGTGSAMPAKPIGDEAFYSDDDGTSFFTDTMKQFTPFKHGGKDAVRARVYKCGSGPAFVGYLERHTEAAKQNKGIAMEMNNRPSFGPVAIFEVKAPKQKDWIPVDEKNSSKALAIMSVSCPGGKSDEVPVMIYPGQQ